MLAFSFGRVAPFRDSSVASRFLEQMLLICRKHGFAWKVRIRFEGLI